MKTKKKIFPFTCLSTFHYDSGYLSLKLMSKYMEKTVKWTKLKIIKKKNSGFLWIPIITYILLPCPLNFIETGVGAVEQKYPSIPSVSDRFGIAVLHCFKQLTCSDYQCFHIFPGWVWPETHYYFFALLYFLFISKKEICMSQISVYIMMSVLSLGVIRKEISVHRWMNE